jgi:hypothetical protein
MIPVIPSASPAVVELLRKFLRVVGFMFLLTFGLLWFNSKWNPWLQQIMSNIRIATQHQTPEVLSATDLPGCRNLACVLCRPTAPFHSHSGAL